MKKKSRSFVCRRPVGKNLKPIPDSQIDFSGIPELSDAQLVSMQRIGSSSEDPSKSRRQVVTKKLQQLRSRSADRKRDPDRGPKRSKKSGPLSRVKCLQGEDGG